MHLLKFGSSGSTVKNPPATQEPQKMWLRSLGWEDNLEEGMAAHSCILAWRIPWTEKPGRLQSIVSQRVGHDWSDLANKFDFNYKCYNLFYGKFIINLNKRPKYLHSQRLKSCDLFGSCFSFHHFYKHYHYKKPNYSINKYCIRISFQASHCSGDISISKDTQFFLPVTQNLVVGLCVCVCVCVHVCGNKNSLSSYYGC